ncbi:MAG TPA: hypothetical protein V6C91_09675 [Coleofasciculaceae cyanobacterium]
MKSDIQVLSLCRILKSDIHALPVRCRERLHDYQERVQLGASVKRLFLFWREFKGSLGRFHTPPSCVEKFQIARRYNH